MRSFQSGAVLIAVAWAAPAFAHVDVRGPGIAGTRQVLTFTVGHGCAGADTIGVSIQLPADVTAMRALPAAFGGEPAVETSSAGVPLRATWSKLSARDADDLFYELQMRITVPDKPFERIYFKATQTCRSPSGEETVVEWSALPGEMGEPAAALLILPARHPGWNKIRVETAIDDLSIFDDAEIVWSGDAAYSGNPATMELIANEPGVQVLSAVTAGSEIWVKY